MVDNNTTLDRILAERLDQFEVPIQVRNALRDEILAFFQRPEKKPFGASVMTAEASAAADKERTSKVFDPNAAKPKIV